MKWQGASKVQSAISTPLLRRFVALPLEKIADRRSNRGPHRHLFSALISALAMGMLCGCKNLEQVEQITVKMSRKARKITGISSRISDTKLRDTQRQISAQPMRQILHDFVHVEHRRGTLSPVDLPFGAVVIDGKGLGKLDSWAHQGVQKVHPTGQTPYGLARNLRTTLISGRCAVGIDQIPIPGATNEIGAMADYVNELIDIYAKTSLFELICADAGLGSAAIATSIDHANKAYLLRLSDLQGAIYGDGVIALNNASCGKIVKYWHPTLCQYEVYRVYRVAAPQHSRYNWGHFRQWIRLEHEWLDAEGQSVKIGRRDFATNLPVNRLTDQQMLTVIRRFWLGENGNHWVADRFFNEDARRQPWTRDPETLYMLSNLRQIALNILAICRQMTPMAGRLHRGVPWQFIIDLAKVLFLSGIDLTGKGTNTES